MTDQQVVPPKKGFVMANRTYDFWKNVVQLFLPALGAFYAAIAPLWGFPKSVEVVGTLAALAVLGGVALKISSRNYDPGLPETVGTMEVWEDEERKNYGFDFDVDPYELDKKDAITLRVKQVDPPGSGDDFPEEGVAG